MPSNHKFESNKKYFTISIYTIAVILIGCVIFRFITQWSNTSKLISQLWEILFPFFMGFLIAYILNPVVAFIFKECINKTFKEEICQYTAWTRHFDQLSCHGWFYHCMSSIYHSTVI